MGRIAKILSVLHTTKNGARQTDIKIDPGNGANVTAQYFAETGADSQPMPGDYVYYQQATQTGSAVVIGLIDPDSAPVAGPGEVRHYARDSGGTTQSAYWLKADGSIVLTTAAGDNTFAADGSITFSNGAQIDAQGVFIDANGINSSLHTHIGNLGNPTSAPTP